MRWSFKVLPARKCRSRRRRLIMRQTATVIFFRSLILVMLIIGMAISLPVAHALSLYTPHAAPGPQAPERDCSLATCGAYTLDGAALLSMLVIVIAALLELRLDIPLYIPPLIDIPPRLAR